MSVLPQSRYNHGSIVRMQNSSGVYNLTVLRTIPPAQAAFHLYIWQSGDRPELVANAKFGNPKLWWAIFDINPEIIYPLDIPAGTVVRIPNNPIMGQGTLTQ